MTAPREVRIGPLIAEVHFSTALEGLGQRLHILHGRFSAHDIAIAWAGDPLSERRFRVGVSEDYNMLTKTGFGAAVGGQEGMLVYLLSGEAEASAIQGMLSGHDAVLPEVVAAYLHLRGPYASDCVVQEQRGLLAL